MSDGVELLTDDEVLAFIVRGYHLVEPDLPPGLNEAIRADLERLPENPGNAILERVPRLREVYGHPKVCGALISLLGPDMDMNAHRHHHMSPPGSVSQNWHQDGTNVRHHQIRTVLAMYYPQDVTPQMGPTAVVPGSHFRNAPTDRMATYANIKGQVFLTVKAGTIAITHYDIWHAATLNRSPRPRHMLKFLFDRKSEPTAPSWNHDAQAAEIAARRWIPAMVGPPIGYNSDYYKEWQLRREMWDWLCGKRADGHAFKDLLG
jgi:hypothetical protein